MTQKLLLPFLLVLATSLGALGGWAKFGIIKTRASFVMHHPPAFHAPGRQLTLEVTSLDPRGGPVVAPRLEQLLDQSLGKEDLKLMPGAPTVLECAVTEAAAQVERQKRSESVNVHVGEHTETDKNGKEKTVEDCKYKQVEVTYLVSSGRLSLNVTATDATSRSVLFTDAIHEEYKKESAVDGPKKCGGATYEVAGDQLRDSDAVFARLSERAAAAVARLAAGYDEPREVLLAVDDELKAGNRDALSGNWDQALEKWTAASVRKQDTEAARQYNLGVAREALAAAAMRKEALDEAASHLKEAEQCYQQALKLGPGEKYFRDTLERLERDRQVLERERGEQVLKQAETAETAGPPTPTPATPTVNIPLEGWPEGEPDFVHTYRAYVRGRVDARKEVSDALKSSLISDASDYEVKPGVAARIVDSEFDRFRVLRENQQKYIDLYKELAADGRISPDEREVLKKRQRTLHLADDWVKEAEEGRVQRAAESPPPAATVSASRGGDRCGNAREDIRQAEALAEKGQPAQARTLLRSALLVCPSDGQNLNLLAEAYDLLGDYPQAGTFREQAMRMQGVSAKPTVDFRASSSSIERGQTATLNWNTSYATEVEITPGIGRVAAKGAKIVAPTSATTYQLAARGLGGSATASREILVTTPRLAEADVLDLLTSGVPKARIAQLAAERGVAFDVSAEVEQRLRGAGADDSLIRALKRAHR